MPARGRGPNRPYIPGALPSSVDPDLAAALFQEFNNIYQALLGAQDYDVLHAAPGRTYPGMVRYADGSDWNPGSGEGLYVYTSGGWVKL